MNMLFLFTCPYKHSNDLHALIEISIQRMYAFLKS